MLDVVIIGAGVVGCAVARVLSARHGNFAVLEAGEDVSVGASKANSGIVHAGFDAVPGTLKARYNVRGAALYPVWAAEMGVPYRRNGALVCAYDPGDLPTLHTLYAQGQANGVADLELLDGAQVRALEPAVNPAVAGALWARGSAVVSPYDMTLAMAYHAAQNGVRFVFNAPVTAITHESGVYTVTAGGRVYTAKAVVNCAGAGADRIRAMLSPEKITLHPRRGEYYLMDATVRCPFTRTMFQVPGKMGKGVLVTPTAHGNTLLGPSAEEISDPADTATTRAGLDFVLSRCRLTWPEVSTRNTITTFAGVRAHEEKGDFLVGAVPGAPAGAFEAAGIESPGLSSAPAIGEDLAAMAADYLGLKEKAHVAPPVPLLKPFAAMTDEERAQACRENPAYGSIVCRCEQITEAEILDAIHRPVGARSIDGVKRRTRAGMGRCQGGFCSPRVLEMLCRETGMSPLEVTKCGGESRLLTGRLNGEKE